MYNSIKCVVLNCYKDIIFNKLEDHMAEEHQDMLSGEWVAHKRDQTAGIPINNMLNYGEKYAMRTWKNAGTRFYATLMVLATERINCNPYGCGRTIPSESTFWNLWVTAACSKTDAENFRAEIRLSSNILPEMTHVSHMPVAHLESDIIRTKDRSSFVHYKDCLRMHHEIISKHVKGDAKSLKDGADIPFKCLVHKKVFLNVNKADMEEKNETNE